VHLPGDSGRGAAFGVQVEEREQGTTVVVTVRRFEVTPRPGQTRFLDVWLPGAAQMTDAGRPALPQIVVPLLLNGPARVTAVRVQEHTVEGVTPAPHSPRPKRCGPGQASRTVCDLAVYDGTARYPEAAAEVVRSGVLRRAPVTVLAVRPFAFLPDRRALVVALRVEVDLDSRLWRGGPDGYASAPFSDLRNAGFFAASGDDRAESGPLGYLVIAHDSLVDAVGPLAEWKSRTGYSVTVMPLSEVGDSYQEVAAAVTSAYETFDVPPTYVLLVGDGEGAAKVPFVPSPYGCASDFLYSVTDGDDLYSDVLVGRFSAHTPEQVQLQVAKTLWYEAGIESKGDSGWVPSSLCISSSEGEGGSNDDVRSDAICKVQADHGYAPTDKLYHSMGNDSAAAISAKLAEGRGWVTYLGHGSGTGWATTEPEYSVQHVVKLANTFKLPFIMDVSCSNGGFDSPAGDCFAEAWMKTGSVDGLTAAVGIYSASTPAAWDEPAEMAVGLTHAVLDDGVVAWGAACAAGRAYMLQQYPGGAVEETCHQYVVFGDPSLSLRSRKAAPLAVDHPPMVPLGGTDVQVAVQREGQPVDGATVAFSSGGTVVAMAKTGTDGVADLSVTLTAEGVVHLTVFAPDSLVYEADIVAELSGCGVLQVKPNPAACAASLLVTLFDADLAPDAGKVETATVTVSSDAGTPGMALVLTETGPASGKFTGQVALASQPAGGTVVVKDGGTVTVTYQDASCDGASKSVGAGVFVDCVGPGVSQVAGQAVSATQGKVTFVTDEWASAVVRWGTSTPLVQECSAQSGLAHEAQIGGLEPSTKVLFEIEAVDAAGNVTPDDNGGAYYTLTTPACTPACEGKVCGPDGCGGECGACCSGQSCGFGVCVGGPGCDPSESAACGGCACEACVCGMDPYCCDTQWDDLCAGECVEYCGGCPAEPSCGGKECGPDGCGGTCGECPGTWACTDAGLCVEECFPYCLGKDCGPDGCGGSCGPCDDGTCAQGKCLMPCDGVTFEGCCDHDVLHYCDSGFEMVVDCAAQGLTCGWKESVSWYDCVEEQEAAPDAAAHPLWCPGTCPPKCEGKECGPDGCGGECGACGPGQQCENGLCEPVCKPACDGKECGQDGCGGLCGECGIGQQCDAGLCTTPCAAKCSGHECGPDGCGGTCGVCAPGMVCSQDYHCELADVTPDVVTEEDLSPASGGGGGCALAGGRGSTVGWALALVLAVLVLAVRLLADRGAHGGSGRKNPAAAGTGGRRR
jgi:hypothetical protein